MAERLSGKLDPHPIAPSFDHFPSMNAPAPAPLVLTHHRQRAHVSVWRNSPSVASTGTIFEQAKIETFHKSYSSDNEWIRPYTWFFIRYLYNYIKINYQGSKHVKKPSLHDARHGISDFRDMYSGIVAWFHQRVRISCMRLGRCHCHCNSPRKRRRMIPTMQS